MHLTYASILYIYMSKRLRSVCVVVLVSSPVLINVSKLHFGPYYLEVSPDVFVFVVSDGIEFLKRTG